MISLTFYRFLSYELSLEIDAKISELTPLLAGVPSLLSSKRKPHGSLIADTVANLLASLGSFVLSVCLSIYLVFFLSFKERTGGRQKSNI